MEKPFAPPADLKQRIVNVLETTSGYLDGMLDERIDHKFDEAQKAYLNAHLTDVRLLLTELRKIKLRSEPRPTAVQAGYRFNEESPMAMPVSYNAAERADYAKWANDDTCEYAGYWVKPKLDMGSHPWLIDGQYVVHGWVVVKDGCNAIPGAGWAGSMAEACGMIDILHVTGDTPQFHHLLRAIKTFGGLGRG